MKRLIRFLMAIIIFVISFKCDYKIFGMSKEEKYYSAATIDDDFSLDSIIITLSNEESLKFAEYNIEDFVEYDCIDVINLSKSTEELVKKQLIAEKTGNYNEIKIWKDNGMLIDVERFHKQLCLKFRSPIELTEQKIINEKNKILENIKALSQREEFICVDVDYFYKLSGEASNQNYDFGENNKVYKLINLDGALEYASGTNNVKIGVVDTGIFSNHNYLKNVVNENLSKSFSSVLNDPLIDEVGHGTGVAGIIGAIKNPDNNIFGISQSVELVSLKVSEYNSYNSIQPNFSNVASAIDYATEINIPILNISLSFNEDLVDYSLKSAVGNYSGLIVCAAGNGGNNNDLYPVYPACYSYDNILTVGATDNNFIRYSTSNYGKTSVDLFAPGSKIISTYNNGDYTQFVGTSFATPLITGVAALIKSINQQLTAEEIKSIIMHSVTPADTLAPECVSGGLLNAATAMQYTLNGFQHSYSHKYASKTMHTSTCWCCYDILQPHVLVSGDPNFADRCIFCNGYIGGGFVQYYSMLASKISANGSYILRDGVIVLNKDDVEPYQNGKLVFNDKTSLQY